MKKFVHFNEEISGYAIPESYRGLLKFLEDKKDEFINAYNVSEGNINFSFGVYEEYGDHHYGILEIYACREETDEEYSNRLERESAQKVHSEQEQRKLYESLKEKFEVQNASYTNWGRAMLEVGTKVRIKHKSEWTERFSAWQDPSWWASKATWGSQGVVHSVDRYGVTVVAEGRLRMVLGVYQEGMLEVRN